MEASKNSLEYVGCLLKRVPGIWEILVRGKKEVYNFFSVALTSFLALLDLTIGKNG